MPRVYKRKFDWDAAARLRAQGLTYKAIGEALGVTPGAIYLALNDDLRTRERERSDRWHRQGTCPDCGVVTTRQTSRQSRRCRDCSALAKASTVRDKELQCVTCREWKPDDDFYRNAGAPKARRGRHQSCRVCNTTARREYRARNREREREHDRAYRRRRREHQRAEA